MSQSTLEHVEPVGDESSSIAPALVRLPLRDAVPEDRWLYIRLVGFAAFVVAYIAWFVMKGLIIDRISVGISVGVFIVIGHLGRPLRRWAWLVLDCLCYCVMWFCYDESRGWADKAGFELQVNAPRNIDRFLFFGTDPNVVLQRHFYNKHIIHWYDKVASVTYFTHFIVPIIAIAVLWVTSHREWARFIKRFATLLLIACAMFVLLPTAPPWMAANQFHSIAPLARHTSRGFSALGLHGFVNSWQSALDWGNAVAAMPSLHASFALFVVAFFLPRIKQRWLKALLLVFPVMMLTALVYFGEHWVIDGLIGWLIVGGSFLFWGWHERRQRRVRANKARNYVMSTVPAKLGGPRPRRQARPKVRSVLLDASFINALLAVDSPHHVATVQLYAALVDRYQNGLDRLFALSPVLGDLPREFRRSALAPVTTTRVARQHRSAARRVAHAPSEAVALGLVMMRRERIRCVATVTDDYDGFDVQVLDLANVDPANLDPANLDPANLHPANLDPANVHPANVDVASFARDIPPRPEQLEPISSGTELTLSPQSTGE